MGWSQGKAATRIERLAADAPSEAIAVERFSKLLLERAGDGAAATAAVLEVPRDRAVQTDGVHVYANLTEFNARVYEEDGEGERSQEKLLQSVHRHYCGCDQLIAAFGMQRVDFHGGRLHAVVLLPLSADGEAERLRTALAFASAFRELARRLSAQTGDSLGSKVRVGIDSGPAIAINNGRGHEQEPLFIGSPANHAAKAAFGDEPGIFLTQRASRALADTRQDVRGHLFKAQASLEASALDAPQTSPLTARARERLDEAYASVLADARFAPRADGEAAQAVFSFHHHRPPLRSVVFADHPPSNAILMPMASIFADIDGFTAYIDVAIASGQVAQAVANLHVMRGEMANVLRDDFDGRKVRYVGDCIHGVIAEGDARSTDPAETVRTAVMASGGIRSSFELCRKMLPGAAALGVAIGIELGQMPLCRLGLRGEASVRCAASRAACVSEEVQQTCDGDETAIGPAAFEAADFRIRHVFAGAGRRHYGLGHASLSALINGVGGQVLPTPRGGDVGRPFRAYGE